MVRLLYFKDKWTKCGEPLQVTETEFLRIVRSRTQQKETSDGFVLGSFKEGFRRNEDFLETSYIALDFDSGHRLAEVQSHFENHWHIIYTSLSHTVENEKFRLVLKLSEPLKREDFASTLKVLISQWQADKSCSNPARLWFGGKDVVSFNFNGSYLKLPQKTPEAKFVSKSIFPNKKLSARSIHFLEVGAPKGEWHRNRLTFLMNAYHQGFTPEEVRALFSKNHRLDQNDEYHIHDVYNRYFYKKVG